jgi:hypothetical protein
MVAGRALKAEVNLVCSGGRGVLRDWRGDEEALNAPQYFDLAVADEGDPVPWDHSRFSPDVIVISLGNNDFNRDLPALPKRERFVSAYADFLTHVLAVHPRARVFVTDGPMIRDDGEGPRKRKTLLQQYLQAAVKQLANEQVRFVPAAELPGDGCDGHPTREQHRLIAAELVPEIRQALEW